MIHSQQMTSVDDRPYDRPYHVNPRPLFPHLLHPPIYLSLSFYTTTAFNNPPPFPVLLLFPPLKLFRPIPILFTAQPPITSPLSAPTHAVSLRLLLRTRAILQIFSTLPYSSISRLPIFSPSRVLSQQPFLTPSWISLLFDSPSCFTPLFIPILLTLVYCNLPTPH